jgi:aspartate kinase
VLVMKFGGTSVATPEARTTSAGRVISAKEQGFAPVVVVSAIGRKGAPYATDTLISFLKDVDPQVAPHPRELDMMMACGEILSSVVFAHTLKARGYPAVALTGLQAGIETDDSFGVARIRSIDPSGIQALLDEGKMPVRLRLPRVIRSRGRSQGRDHDAGTGRIRHDRFGAGRCP